jgi:hypothetical protein
MGSFRIALSSKAIPNLLYVRQWLSRIDVYFHLPDGTHRFMDAFWYP